MGRLKTSIKSFLKRSKRAVDSFRQYRRLNLFIKLTVGALLIWALYVQILAKEQISEIWTTFRSELQNGNLWLLGLVFLLMPLNWALETLKWQRLVRTIEIVPFFRAFQGILAGVTLSIFTPNRLGEYGGRILVVKPENKIATVVATAVGSFSQWVVLLVAGMVGLSYFISEKIELEYLVMLGTAISAVLLSLLLVLFYLNVDLAIPLCKKIPYIRRFVRHFEVLNHYTTKALLVVLSISASRYFVYSLQYYLLLKFFGIDVPFLLGLSSIALIFFVQTSIPLPPVYGLAVRGNIALRVWAFFTANTLGILSSTFGLWLINVILPALVGMLFISRLNILKSFGYDEKENESKEEKSVTIP